MRRSRLRCRPHGVSLDCAAGTVEGVWKGQVKITILLAMKEAEKLLRLVDSHSALEKEINSVEALVPAAKS